MNYNDYKKSGYTRILFLVSMMFMFMMSVASASIFIQIDGPFDGTYVQDNNATFLFTPTISNESVVDCSLYGDFSGNFILEDTILNVTNATQYNFDKANVADGSYAWNVNCVSNTTSATSENNTVIFDTTSPSVSIKSPQTNDNLANNFLVNVNAADNIGVKEVRANGQLLTLATGNSLNGTYAGTIDSNTLTDGLQNILVTVEDNAGNVANASVEVMIDNVAPEVRFAFLDRDEDGNIYESWGLYPILAEDEQSGINSIYIVNNSNFRFYMEEGNDNYAFYELRFGYYDYNLGQYIYPQEGLNNVTFYIEDNAGNSAYYSVEFIVDTTNPFGTLISPLNGSTYNSNDENIEVSFTYGDNLSGVENVRVRAYGYNKNGNYVGSIYHSNSSLTSENGTYTYNIESQYENDGKYGLYFQLNDKAGNYFNSRDESYEACFNDCEAVCEAQYTDLDDIEDCIDNCDDECWDNSYTTFIEIDNNAPYFMGDLIKPYTNQIYDNTPINITVLADDSYSGVKEVLLESNHAGAVANFSMNKIDNTTFNFIIDSVHLNEGDVIDLSYYGEDNFGNIAYLSSRTLYVGSRGPIVNESKDWTQNISEGSSPVTLDLTGWVYDLDKVDSSLTWELIFDNNNDDLFALEFNADTQVLVITLANNDVYGSETLSFKVTDTQGNFNYAVMNINVLPVNDAPFFNSTIPNFIVTDNGTTQHTIDITDYCDDSADGNYDFEVTVDLNQDLWKSPLNDIVYTNTITFKAAENAAQVANVSDVITITCSDGELEDSTTVTGTITPFNEPPVSPKLVSPVDNADLTLVTSDPSVVLEWEEGSDPENQDLTYTVYVNNESLVNTTDLTYTLTNVDNGTYTWYVLSNDGMFDSAKDEEFSFTVVVEDDGYNNTAPVFNGTIPDVEMDEDDNLLPEINLNNYFSDADGDVLTFTNSDVAGITFEYVNGAAIVTPDENLYGIRTVVFTGADRFNSTQSNEVTIVINPVNDAPVIENIADREIPVEREFTLDVVAEDVDGDVLTYNITGGPEGMVISQSGRISGWTPRVNESGDVYDITVIASDDNLTDSETFTITVDPNVEHSYKVSGNINFQGVEPSKTYEETFTIQNDGGIDFDQISLSLSSDLESVFNAKLSSNNFALNVGDTKTITLTITAPVNETIENEIIGTIAVSAENINKTINVYTKPLSYLDIEELKVKVDGKRSEVLDGETISKNAAPGDLIEFEVKVLNNLVDLDMEDVEVEITIYDIDDGDDIELDTDAEDIDAEDDFKFDDGLSFEVPLIIEEDIYEILIEVTGEDEDGNNHEVQWTIYLEVEKERHEVLMSRATISPSTLTCIRNADIDITTVNIGNNDEDVRITVKNSELDLDEEREFELEEGNDEDDVKKVLSFRVDVDDDLEGSFPIEVSMYVDDDLEESETLYLEVNECTRKTTSSSGTGSTGSNSGTNTNTNANGGFEIVSSPTIPTPTSPIVQQDDDLFERISDGDLTIPALGVLAAAAGVFVMLMLPK
ncbi:hypothetical protein KY334_00275 [Candidatus Woesearchaeota archaeon]|nr:hypothetical protein [Candidatus Woesearchaeota archaeon]